jgi:hypothetical protein
MNSLAQSLLEGIPDLDPVPDDPPDPSPTSRELKGSWHTSWDVNRDGEAYHEWLWLFRYGNEYYVRAAAGYAESWHHNDTAWYRLSESPRRMPEEQGYGYGVDTTCDQSSPGDMLTICFGVRRGEQVSYDEFPRE